MKQLFLHIGYGKCGTTAIQKFAYKNFKNNSEIYLPDTGWWKDGEGHHLLADDLKEDINNDIFAYKWRRAAEELTSSGADRGFLSSEQFCFLLPAQIEIIHKVLSEYDWEIKIVFFVRSQLDLILSSYMQRLKHESFGQVGGFERFFFLHKSSFDFQERLETWEKLFGLDSLIVKLYDRKLFHNVIDELCKILELTPGINVQQLSDYGEVNRSLVPEFIDLIKLFDEKHQEEGQSRATFINHLMKLSNNIANSSSSIRLFRKEHYQIIEYFKEKNEAFATKFLTPVEQEVLNEKFITRGALLDLE